MNIKDVNQDEFEIISGPSLNIKNLNQEDYEIVSASETSAPINENVSGGELGIIAGLNNSAPSSPFPYQRQTPTRQPAPIVEPQLEGFWQNAVYNPIVNTAADIFSATPEEQQAAQKEQETMSQRVQNIQKAYQNLMPITPGQSPFKKFTRNIPAAAVELGSIVGGVWPTQILSGIAEAPAIGLQQLGIMPDAMQRYREQVQLMPETAKIAAQNLTEDVKALTEEKMMGREQVQENLMREALARPQVEITTPTGQKKMVDAGAKLNKFVHDSETMSNQEFYAAYPNALPWDRFYNKFVQAASDSTLPRSAKEIFFDMPLNSVKSVWGIVNNDPETMQAFQEAPAQFLVQAAAGGLMALGLGKKALDLNAGRTTIAPQTSLEREQTVRANQKQQMEYLQKNNQQRSTMDSEINQRTEAMTPEISGYVPNEPLRQTPKNKEPKPQQGFGKAKEFWEMTKEEFDRDNVLYHGGPEITDSVLKRGAGGKRSDMGGLFFTDNKKYAEQYANPAVYEVLKKNFQENVFDPRKPEHIEKLKTGFLKLVEEGEYETISDALRDFEAVKKNDDLLDWSIGSGYTEAIQAAGFDGVVFRERPGNITKNASGSFNVEGKPIYSVGSFKKEIPASRNLHKDIVKKAIGEGQTVPSEVLAEYPDLKTVSLEPAIEAMAPMTNRPAPIKVVPQTERATEIELLQRPEASSMIIQSRTAPEEIITPSKPTDQLFKKQPRTSPEAQGEAQTIPKVETPQLEQPVTTTGQEAVPYSENPPDNLIVKHGQVVRVAKNVFSVSPKDIDVEPKRFQFRSDVNSKGVTNKFVGINFNPEQSGIISVWVDPIDNRMKVVDGHHRLGMANESNQDSVNIQFLNSKLKTEKEARIFGALKNIGDDTGTSIDAAKIFRELGTSDIKKINNLGTNLQLNQKNKMYKQGKELANLSDLAWQHVINDKISTEVGEIIGRELNQTQQNSAVKQMAFHREKTQKPITTDYANSLSDALKNMGESIEGEADMFGEIISSMPIEQRGEIDRFIQENLKTKKSAFKFATGKKTDILTENIGTEFDKAKAGEELSKTETTLDAYMRLKSAKTNTSEVLNKYAVELAKAPFEANKIKRSALNEIESAIERDISGQVESNSGSGFGNAENGKGNVPQETTSDFFATKPTKPTDILTKKKPKLGMFGAGELQNIYEKAEPTMKKGADIFKKKAGEFIADEEGFVNYDKFREWVMGKPQKDDIKVTIGDPELAKEWETMYRNAQKKETEAKTEAQARTQTMFGAFKQSAFDLFSPIIDRVKDTKEKEETMKTLHDIFYLPASAEAFMRDTHNIIIKNLEKNGMTNGDYSAYLTNKWIEEYRAGKGVKSPKEYADAKRFIDSIDPDKRKVLFDITKEYHEKVWTPIIQELKDSGLGDDVMIDSIMDNENYAPFFFAKHMGLDYGSREYNAGGGVQALTTGATGDILDPFAMKNLKGPALLAAAAINRGKLAARDALIATGELKEAKPKITGRKLIKGNDGQPLLDKKDQKQYIPIVEFDEPSSTSNMALMVLREDGKKKGYYVPKEVQRSFDMAMGGADNLGAAMKLFSQGTNFFRNVWIEYNPAWQVMVNAPRDIATAAIEMPGAYNKLKFLGNVPRVAISQIGEYVPFFKNMAEKLVGFKYSDEITKMLKDKKLLSTREMQYASEGETPVLERQMKEYNIGRQEKENIIMRGLDEVQEFGKNIERMTKLAADLTLRGSKYSASEIVTMIRRVGSPSFAVRGGGILFDTLKTAGMFYNATKEGWRAADYFFRKDPAGFTTAASVPLALVAAMVLAENGKFGPEIASDYAKVKETDKQNKINIPLWLEKDKSLSYLALPVPQILKPFMSMIRLGAKENPKVLESIATGISNELPTVNPLISLISRLTSYGMKEPPETAFGSPIMHKEVWKSGGMDKALAFTKSFWNDYLLGSQWRLQVNPNDPETSLKQKLYTALFGKLIHNSYNAFPDTSLTDESAAKSKVASQKIMSIEDPEERKALLQQYVKEGVIKTPNDLKQAIRDKAIQKISGEDKEKAAKIKLWGGMRSKNPDEKKAAIQHLFKLIGGKK